MEKAGFMLSPNQEEKKRLKMEDTQESNLKNSETNIVKILNMGSSLSVDTSLE